MSEFDQYARDRRSMVEQHIRKRGIRDERILQAMGRVPRHLFVPPGYRDVAYSDGPLRIGEGQTISQPYIVALMTQLLRLTGEERVLEVGTGSGYQAAILGELAEVVHTIERHPSLAAEAQQVLASLGYDNIHVHVGDGTLGLPDHAPYGAIITTAAAPSAPPPLLEQLADGGRLVLPVGGRYNQNLERHTRRGDQWRKEILTPVAFVPLVGEEGWNEDDRGFFGL